MPVSRSYTKKTRTARQYKKKPTLTKRVRTIVNRIAEEKYINITLGTQFTSMNHDAWKYQSALAGIIQGTTAHTRLGNKIFVKAIHFAIECNLANVGAIRQENESCEMVAYHNKQANGTAMSSGLMWNTDEVGAVRNLDQTHRVKIQKYLYHTFQVFGDPSVTTKVTLTGWGVMRFSIYPKKVIEFQSNAGTISDILSDDFGFGAAITGYNGLCTLTGTMQTVFTDY